MKKIIYSVIILLVFVGFSKAQTKLTLSDAINIGLENNYSIRISKKNLEISDENNTWGAAGRFPTIDVGVSSVNRFDHNDDAEITTNNLTPFAQLNWVLFNGFQIYYTKSKLEDLQKLSKGSIAVIVENTIKSIVLAYYDVLLKGEILNVFEEVESLSKDRYDRTLMSKEIGGAVTFEVLQAKIAWLEDKSNYLSQKLNYDNSIRTLNLLIGEKTDKHYEALDPFETDLNDYLFDELKEKMLVSNKTLKNQYLSEILNEREIGISRSGIFPKLNLNAGYDYLRANQKINSLPRTESDSYDYYANLNLSINLFNGFNTKRSLEIAKIQHEISKVETEEMIHTLSNTLTQLLDLYNIQKDLLVVANENIEASKLNLQISEEKFKSGAINSFNYRDTQIIYLNASIQRLNSIYNLISTNTELARLTGSLISER